MNLFVNGTVRENACDTNSAITSLVTTQKLNGHDVLGLEILKPYADQGRLWVHHGAPCGAVQIRIYWSTYYRRYIATTRADGTVCNNLLSLKIYYPGSNSLYTECRL